MRAHLSLSARVNPAGCCFVANNICEGLVGMVMLGDDDADDAVVGEGP